MLGSFVALGVLSVLNKRPPLTIIVAWIDYETVMLLFGMMIIVGVLSETGIFEWSAVKAYKLSGGHVWRLITLLCVFSAVVSAFLVRTLKQCGWLFVTRKPINIWGLITRITSQPFCC